MGARQTPLNEKDIPDLLKKHTGTGTYPNKWLTCDAMETTLAYLIKTLGDNYKGYTYVLEQSNGGRLRRLRIGRCPISKTDNVIKIQYTTMLYLHDTGWVRTEDFSTWYGMIHTFLVEIMNLFVAPNELTKYLEK